MAETAASAGAQFWESSTDTHRADDDYYELVAETLETRILPLIEPQDRLLDFGCGNGEYTRLLGRRAGSVLGIDVSPALIERARAESADLPDIDFVVGTSPPEGESFDVVACMGVLVCVLETAAFRALLGQVADATKAGGVLLLRETLSWSGSQVIELDDYVAHYRTPLDYLEPLAEAGLELIEDIHLATWSERDQRSNHLWILKRMV